MMVGTTIGSFTIIAKLGEGGMGEVYRATDTRLKRQVAIKVLPATLTTDPDRLARFQREAEVLASLNHPNIAALYGLEEAQGVKALVMELVEGPTLADRLAHGPMPIAEALPIAAQIADALAAAHEQNVIHRDLKPANIKLRPDGTVKVLDFGLAKALAVDDPKGSSLQQTVTSPAMTLHGVILGTAAYMSPEQAAGRPVDRRTDLWAFGVVLFEMLTGRRLFDGESVSHVIAAVLKDEPEWSALPAETPAGIRRLLRRCLERDRKQRWPDAATARMECDDALAPGGVTPSAGSGSISALRSPWHIVAGMVFGVAIAAVAAWARWPAADPPSPVGRFEIELPDDRVLTRTGRHVLAFSPDGTQIAYVANRQLFLRALSDTTAVSLAGTNDSDPAEPIFSPDGQWLAFWSNGQLKKIPLSGGTAVTLAAVANPYGLSWTGDRILLGVDDPPRIVEVPANGGPAATLVTLSADELAQRPQLVNDGAAVLFTLRKGDGAWQDATVVVHDLATGRRTVLVEHGTDAQVVQTRHLIYERESTLFAIAFDERRLAVTGSPVPVQTDVMEALGGFSGAAQMAISNSGSLAFVPTSVNNSGTRALLWLDRSGVTERLTLPEARHFTGRSQSVSPDGTRIATRVVGTTSAMADIWIGDLTRGTFTRVSFSGRATDPIWSADGARVCYENLDEVFCQSADGSGTPRSLFTWPRLNTLEEFSPDGRWLLFELQPDSTARREYMVANMQSLSEARLIFRTGTASSPSVSPDGRWVAYGSEESGRDEIYVRPFPNVGDGRWQVSLAGGDRPNWSHNGRELFYLASASAGSTSDVTIMTVPIRPGPTFSAGAPAQVVKFPPNAAFNYRVAADGRFLINLPAADSGVEGNRFIVVQNWFEELRAKVPR